MLSSKKRPAMIMRNEYFSLATLIDKIISYCRSNPHGSEATLLLELHRNLKALESTYTNVDIIDNIALNLNDDFTQENLIAETFKTYSIILQSATLQLNHIIDLLNAYFQEHFETVDETFTKLFQYISFTLQSILTAIEKLVKTDYKKFNEYLNNSYLLDLSNSLYGRYLPAFYMLDPFRNFELKAANKIKHISDDCFLAVLQWADQCKQYGRAKTVAFINSTYFNENNLVIYVRERFKQVLVQPFHRETDFRDYIFKCLVNSNKREIYLIVLSFLPNAHAIGYRAIPNSEEIELFDRNMGIQVLPNIKSFINFLAAHLLEGYFDLFKQAKTTGYFAIHSLGRQPADAKVSIPPFLRNQATQKSFNHNMTYSINEFAAVIEEELPDMDDGGFLRYGLAHYYIRNTISVLFMTLLNVLIMQSLFNPNHKLDLSLAFKLTGLLLYSSVSGTLLGVLSGYMSDYNKTTLNNDNIINRDNAEGIALDIHRERIPTVKNTRFSLFNYFSNVNIIRDIAYLSVSEENPRYSV